MKRRIFNALAVVSLLLVLAVAGLWARSRVRSDALIFDEGGDLGGQFVARSSLGGLWVATGTLWTEYRRPRGWELIDERPEPIILGKDMAPGPLWRWLGVSAGRVNSAVFDSFEMAVPHWLLILIFSALPVMWLVMRLRRPKLVGLCAKCGYDLRASTGTCPECGAPIPAKAN